MKELVQRVNKEKISTSIVQGETRLFGKNAVCISSTPQGHLHMKDHPYAAATKTASFDGRRFEFQIRELEPGQLDPYKQAVLKSRRTGTRISCADFVIQENGLVTCVFDVSDKETANQLPSGYYDLLLESECPDRCSDLQVLTGERPFAKPIKAAGQRYRYALATGDFEGISVARAWGRLQNTKHRRSVMHRKVFMPLYRIARTVMPIDRKMILFESYWGTQTGCNPGGFYRYMDEHHKEYTCVWSVEDERMLIEGGGKRIRKGSLPYYVALARAHYLMSNVNFENWYKKRHGQIEIQTTHGTPLKTVGFAAPDEFPTEAALESFAKRCSRWDYLIAPGPRAQAILANNYHFTKQFLNTGFPRNDELFAMNNPKDIARIKRKFGVPIDKKLVIYAPTWRVQGRFDLELDLTKMADILDEEYAIGLRPHHFCLKGIDWSQIDARIHNLSKGPSAAECYLMADVLITDYSSMMFDYAILGKPMLFFVYDLDDYRDNLRGFNFDFANEAPGPLLQTSDEVIDALVHLDDVVAECAGAYRAFADGFCGYEHGTAGEQIFHEAIEPNA